MHRTVEVQTSDRLRTFRPNFTGGGACLAVVAFVAALAAAAPAQTQLGPMAPASPTATPATPVPLDTPAPGVTPPADVAARARGALDGLRSGNVDRRTLSGDLNAVFNDDVLRGMQANLQGLGNIAGFAYVRTMTPQGTPIYAYRVSGTSGQPDQFELISFDGNGKISRLSFVTQMT